MKSLRWLCVSFVLAIALSTSAFAGVMDTPKTDQQPPPASATTQGDMGTPIAPPDAIDGVEEATAVDPLVETVLNLVSSVVALF